MLTGKLVDLGFSQGSGSIPSLEISGGRGNAGGPASQGGFVDLRDGDILTIFRDQAGLPPTTLTIAFDAQAFPAGIDRGEWGRLLKQEAPAKLERPGFF